jgi:hypothetical protein
MTMNLVEGAGLATLYRAIHLVGMAVLLGGAVLVALRGTGRADRAWLREAQRYEWFFWAAMLLQVISGIGNLGVRGAGVPGPEQPWGALLYLKLVLVLLLLLASLVRSTAVARLLAAEVLIGEAPAEQGQARVGLAYGATVALLGLIVLAAVRMAHG